MDLSSIFLAFYRPANRFHISVRRGRGLSVAPWYFVSGPTKMNVQRVEDYSHANGWQRLEYARSLSL